MQGKLPSVIGLSILSMSLFLGIAAFAGYSVFAEYAQVAPENTPIRLEAADDPLRNGFNFINKRRSDLVKPPAVAAEPLIILLNDWIYTGKPGNSGFN